MLTREGNVIPWDLIEGQIKATHDYEASTERRCAYCMQVVGGDCTLLPATACCPAVWAAILS